LQVHDLRLVETGEYIEIRAQITGLALREPFPLWYRFPAALGDAISTDSGNPFVPGLLLPAMATGDSLELDLPISPRLYNSLRYVQAFYHCLDPSLAVIDVRAPLRTSASSAAPHVGLFFSLGVDSFYTLLKNTLGHPLTEDAITHLVVVHGMDIGSYRKTDVFQQMISKTRLAAERVGKNPVDVSTNLKTFMTKLGFGPNFGTSATMASIGLFLERTFGKHYGAAGLTYAQVEKARGGPSPVLDHLWSTERTAFLCDGCETDRLGKIRFLARSDVPWDLLRVCWINDIPDYNCGRCSKCLRTMLCLHIAGLQGKCRTLPSHIDPDRLRSIPLVDSQELTFINEILDERRWSAANAEIVCALQEGVSRASTYFTRLDDTKESIAGLIPQEDQFILVDGDDLRLGLGAGRKVILFYEPKDDASAIRELERLRLDGARFVVFWPDVLWWLKYYTGLNQHLRASYRCLVDNDNTVMFDLSRSAEP